MTDITKSLFTCLVRVRRGRYCRLPQWHVPHMMAIGPPSLRRILPLFWLAALATFFFLQGFARSHVAVPCVTDRSATGTIVFPPFRRIEKYSPVPIGPAFGPWRRKCLERHTHKHRPAYFFPANHQKNSSSIKAPMLTHWSLYSLYYYLL